MSIVLVSDVFGKTPALVELGEELNANIIVDPYNGQFMGFRNEYEAYSYFMEKIGFEAYLTELLSEIQSLQSVRSLIGFSVGASAIWKLSDRLSADTVKHAICFYGSQIRYFTEVFSNIEIEVILPKSEAHFDVLALQASLAVIPNVTTCTVDYLHGFMNYYSDNYNHQGYKETVHLLRADGS